jgi:phosphoglycerol transferase MdoB-like AlkP superfamily enzyme
MLKSIERLPISAINLVLLSAFLLGALIAGALGSWTGAAYLGALGLIGLAGALYARRSGSRDVTRLNALEWRDERDRTLAKSGFAAVGAVALLMVLAQLIVVVVTDAGHDSPFMWVTLSQMLILYIAWGIANSVAVRRG